MGVFAIQRAGAPDCDGAVADRGHARRVALRAGFGAVPHAGNARVAAPGRDLAADHARDDRRARRIVAPGAARRGASLWSHGAGAGPTCRGLDYFFTPNPR